MADAQSLAMTTVLIAVGSTEAALISKKKAPTMKPVIGGFILGVFLMALAAVNNDVTAKFCYLIILGSLLVNGAAALKIAK